MAVYDLEEQEQIDAIKAWWRQYGNRVSLGIALVAVAVIGWQGWSFYQSRQTAEAAVVFSALQHAVQTQDAVKVKNLSGELTEKYGRTSYAALAALIAAKSSLETGDVRSARAQITWAAEHGKDEVAALAQLRLAGLLLDEAAYDEALKVLDGVSSPAFAARVADMRGDVFAAQGQREKAGSAYEAALKAIAALPKGSVAAGQEALIQHKRDALGISESRP